MGFIKSIKSKAYFKRYQVKYRRRREGKTDYYARRRLVTQDKNKYLSPKYRFVARITNKDVICQVIYSKIEGDRCMTAAYAHELPRYGVKVGLTNFAAAYCTGLLAARRLLQKLNLADKYVGQVEADGEMFNVEELEGEDEPRPFCANLDVGVQRTTTGAKIFGCLKGAVDGGLDIPHNEKRFPGYDKEAKAFESELLKERIFGEHVQKYMEELMDEDEERYKIQFARYIAAGVDADSVADMYSEAHAAIRADPSYTKKAAKPAGTYKRWTQKRLTYDERKERVNKKIAERAARSE